MLVFFVGTVIGKAVRSQQVVLCEQCCFLSISQILMSCTLLDPNYPAVLRKIVIGDGREQSLQYFCLLVS